MLCNCIPNGSRHSPSLWLTLSGKSVASLTGTAQHKYICAKYIHQTLLIYLVKYITPISVFEGTRAFIPNIGLYYWKFHLSRTKKFQNLFPAICAALRRKINKDILAQKTISRYVRGGRKPKALQSQCAYVAVASLVSQTNDQHTPKLYLCYVRIWWRRSGTTISILF